MSGLKETWITPEEQYGGICKLMISSYNHRLVNSPGIYSSLTEGRSRFLVVIIKLDAKYAVLLNIIYVKRFHVYKYQSM